jgi:hypothetical protein
MNFSTYLSIFFFFLFIYLFIYLIIYLFIYLSIYLFVLRIHFFISLFAHFSGSAVFQREPWSLSHCDSRFRYPGSCVDYTVLHRIIPYCTSLQQN